MDTNDTNKKDKNNKMKIKKGDKVKIITGKDKGKTGAVLKAFPKDFMVLVEGVNKKKLHQRPKKSGEKGKIIEQAAPVHVSNVVKIKQ
jgi:large subunit ribosomal protein L24